MIPLGSSGEASAASAIAHGLRETPPARDRCAQSTARCLGFDGPPVAVVHCMTEPIQRVDGADHARLPARMIADLVPVTQIMSRNVICARGDLLVSELVDMMVGKRIGCVPVINELGGPIGMVTKLDLVVAALAASREPIATTVRELMMPLAITLGEWATVAHAVALMASEDFHHVPIVDAEGRLIGVVSTMDIVRWLSTTDGFKNPRP
jgi:CBS domain-containing protein